MSDLNSYREMTWRTPSDELADAVEHLITMIDKLKRASLILSHGEHEALSNVGILYMFVDAHPTNAYIVGEPTMCLNCGYAHASLIREAQEEGGILTLACDGCGWCGPHDDIIDPKLTIEKTINLENEGEI